MAQMTPKKHEITEFNNGTGDEYGLQISDASDFTKVVENATYSAKVADSLANSGVDNTEANNVGTAQVEITGTGTAKKFKFKNLKGQTGNGITTITKTGTSGLTDTYTITFTSGATTTFSVSNGKGIASITKTGTSGLVDTYTIAFNDSTSTTFTVTNGAKGDTGATPDLAIGTVTTLETGQQATATISGTSEEPKLNLGLPKGNTGNTGSQGIQGKSYSPKGEWSSATAYVNNATTIDTILYLGSTYYCKQSNTNQTPTNTTYWGLLAEKGSDAGVTIVQTTGQSTAAVMSQKAVSDELMTCERIQNYVIFESDTARTITPKYTNSGVTLQYSIDKGVSWVNIAHNTATPSSAEIWFRGKVTGDKRLFSGAASSNAWSFSGDSTNKLRVKGNLNYLLCDNLGDILAPTTLANYCYSYMFNGCTSLTKAPELPATTLATSCYYYMFNGCTSLTQAPDLPATTLANYCYYYMFNGCTSLTKAPDLPATTLANYCYYYMFNGCTSLTKAPELPATTLANYCYYYMFNGCTSLTQIKCYYPSNLSNTVAQDWLSGINTTGTIYSPNGIITYGRPTNWTSSDLSLARPATMGDLSLAKTETITETIGKIYPIGAIYISTVNTSPASLFGGSWTAYAQGRVLIGMGSNGETNYTTVGATGGSENSVASHSHTQASHSHTINSTTLYALFKRGKDGANDIVQASTGTAISTINTGDSQIRISEEGSSVNRTRLDMSHTHTSASATPTINNAGSNGGNRMPYITVYMWRRTA